MTDWLPIDTAPRDGTEILASDYDAIEIVSWDEQWDEQDAWWGWFTRDGQIMFPSWWQPLPDHPPLPEVK